MRQRLVDARLGLLDLGQRGLRAGLFCLHLLGTVLAGLRGLLPGAVEPLLRLGNCGLLRHEVLFGFEHLRVRGGGGGYRGIVLLAADDILFNQRCIALDVLGRLDGIRLGLIDASGGGGGLLLGLGDGGAGRDHVGAGRAHLGGGRHVGDRHVDVRGLVLGLCGGERGLRLFERDLVVLRVEFDEQLTGLYLGVLLHVHRGDRAGDARADLVNIAIHLRVVRVFGEGGAPVPEDGAEDEQQDDTEDDDLAAGLLGRRFVGGLGGG